MPPGGVGEQRNARLSYHYYAKNPLFCERIKLCHLGHPFNIVVMLVACSIHWCC